MPAACDFHNHFDNAMTQLLFIFNKRTDAYQNVINLLKLLCQALVVQMVDSSVQLINHNPLEKYYQNYLINYIELLTL